MCNLCLCVDRCVVRVSAREPPWGVTVRAAASSTTISVPSTKVILSASLPHYPPWWRAVVCCGPFEKDVPTCNTSFAQSCPIVCSIGTYTNMQHFPDDG